MDINLNPKNKLTPPGTAPRPVRRSTKHKRPEYGLYLMDRHRKRQGRVGFKVLAMIGQAVRLGIDAQEGKRDRKKDRQAAMPRNFGTP